MSGSRPRLLGPWRRLCQWGTTLAVLLIPFGCIGEHALLRIDLPERRLEIVGRIVAIEQFYLLLLATLALALLFLLSTLVLGRVWCGWLCPQTTLSDLAEWAARRIGLEASPQGIKGRGWRPLWRRILWHLFCAALALLVGANLVWYFVPPYDFFPRLTKGELGAATSVSLLAVATVVYLDLALLRRLLCREFCPYGRFQSTLVDTGTLTLQFDPEERSRCLRCNACVRACPTGIDIRRGFQIECINCGRCLDACREVMARRQQSGLIRYRFGSAGKGPRALLTPRTLLLGVALVIVGGAFTTATLTRSPASLKVQRSPLAAPRIAAGGELVTFFTAYLANRTDRRESYRLTARLVDGHPLELRGPVTGIDLEAGERRRIDFAVLSPLPGPAGAPLLLTLYDRENRVLGQARALIPHREDTRP